jgi:hypothetical protein
MCLHAVTASSVACSALHSSCDTLLFPVLYGRYFKLKANFETGSSYDRVRQTM